jgi:hypothetical protein
MHIRTRQRLKAHAERKAAAARKEAARYRDGAGDACALMSWKLARHKARAA